MYLSSTLHLIVAMIAMTSLSSTGARAAANTIEYMSCVTNEYGYVNIETVHHLVSTAQLVDSC